MAQKRVTTTTTSAPKIGRARKTASSDSTTSKYVSDQAIAERAYALFLARGGQHGRHLEDWVEAERQLRAG